MDSGGPRIKILGNMVQELGEREQSLTAYDFSHEPSKAVR